MPTGWPGVAATLARQAGGALAGLVFPPCCLVCRRATAEQNALCAACWRSIRFIEQPFCERLGTPFPLDLGDSGLISPEAMAMPPVYTRARAVARYEDGVVRRLVHRLKYSDRLELAAMMGAWMARAGDELLTEADVLVPVPLYRTRLMSRRFNQSALLAKAITGRTGVPTAVDVLARIRPTPPQVGLSRTQRALNVQGAFRVTEEHGTAIRDRAVVLVDDVVTSGATVNAACRALLRGGARQVDVLAFARVVTSA